MSKNARNHGRGGGLAVFLLGLALVRCGSSSNPGNVVGGAAGQSDAEAGRGGSNSAGDANRAGAGAAGKSTEPNFAGAAGRMPDNPSQAGAAEAGASGAGAEVGASGAPSTERLGYVFDEQVMPTSTAKFAVDLDRDGKPDNAYGRLTSALAVYGFATQNTATAEIAAGRGLQLVGLNVLDSNLVNSAETRAVVARAKATVAPDFSGNGIFTVDSGVDPGNFSGSIANTIFASMPIALGQKPPRLLLRLPFGIAVDVPVQLLSISCHVAVNGLIDGELNGAILATDLDAIVPPALASAFNQTCSGAGAQEPSCQSYLGLFDADKNLTISADELRASLLIQAVLAPDVKLFDAQQTFAPDSAATNKDAFSIGIGFSAVSAISSP